MAMIAIHPGEHLQEELGALAMSAAELARQLDVPANRISQILRGERDITADTAMRLGHFFGTSAQFWTNLQSLYDLRVAQKQSGSAIKALPTLKTLHAHGKTAWTQGRLDGVGGRMKIWVCAAANSGH